MKRSIDLVGGALGLLLLSPLAATVALVVRLKLGSPILFRQERIGRNGRRFELVKFRSMLETRSVDGELLTDEERLTGFGRWLRATSLDELPELVHVVGGVMSLVGPRPLPTAYLDLYTEEQARRHEVRPGLTGWSQVNGRNATSWAERLAMDVWYVDHRSTWLDAQILARTITVVVRRSDINQAGHATMPDFTGE